MLKDFAGKAEPYRTVRRQAAKALRTVVSLREVSLLENKWLEWNWRIVD